MSQMKSYIMEILFMKENINKTSEIIKAIIGTMGYNLYIKTLNL